MSLFGTLGKQIAESALWHRLPSMTTDPRFPHTGGLLAYGGNRSAIYRQAARMVDRILAGASPGSLPMRSPEQLACILNLSTARTLDLAIPRVIRAQLTETVT